MIRNCLQGAVFSDGSSCAVIRSINSEAPDKVPRKFAPLPEGHSAERNLLIDLI